MKSTQRAITVAIVVASLLAACVAGASAKDSATEATVTISVASLIPGSTPAAVKEFENQVKQFERANPGIKVKPVEYQWTGPTFAAKLAARTLPTVFEVPFTDAKTLGERGQLADLTREIKALPYFSKLNPTVLDEATTTSGKIVALPKGAYAQALHYNRKLFSQAGLDPNKPPTTWAQVRAFAKQIAERTGKAGYLQMGKADNTAGWILTTMTYSLGGRMQSGTGSEREGDAEQPADDHRPEPPEDDAVDRQLDGLQLRLRLERHQPGVRGRERRDVHQRLGRLHEPRPGEQHRPEHLRRHDDPAREEQDRRRARRRHARRRPTRRERGGEGRRGEVDRLLLRAEARHQAQAIRNAKSLVANKQPVGVPALPLFNKKQYDLANTWIKPYINVPEGQMKPFTSRIFGQRLIPEPAVATQAVYHALDTVVQAVLTDRNANISQLLQQANSAAQDLMRRT